MSGSFITKYAEKNNLKVRDSRRHMVVTVLAKDLKGARRNNPECCAFARACKRQKKVDAVHFFKTSAWIEKDGVLTRFQLPESMKREIIVFDRGGKFAPGEYQLRAVSKARRLGKGSGKTRVGGDDTRKGYKRPHTHTTAMVRSAAITK